MSAGKRTGDKNFVTCMRLALADHYGDKAVGMGGTFLIEKGKAKTHIMVRALPQLVYFTHNFCTECMMRGQMKSNVTA